MGTTQSSRPLKYTCPVCGKRAVFGTHFCEGSEKKGNGTFASISVKRAVSATVAILLIEVFLWQMIGTLSLYSLILVPIVAALALSLRKLRLDRSKREEVSDHSSAEFR